MELAFSIAFILLGVALVAAIIKYPRDTFITIPLWILGRIISPFVITFVTIWNLAVLVVSAVLPLYTRVFNKVIPPKVKKLFEPESKDHDPEIIPYQGKRKLNVDFRAWREKSKSQLDPLDFGI